MNRAGKRRQKKLPKKAASNAKFGKATIPSPGQQTPTIQQSLELAVRHHNAGDLAKAEGIYQQVLQADPNQPIALHLLGVIAHQVGNHDTAVDLINKAIAINPDYAEAHNNLGNALQVLGRLDEAVASFNKAIAIKPDLAEAHSNLGNALQDLGRLDEAVTSFHKALNIQPDYAEAHSNLGVSLQKLGKLDEAVTSHHKALAIKPDYAEAHTNLGIAYQDLDRLDDAIISFQKALSIKPDYAEVHNNLGNVLNVLGKYEDAVASFQNALAIKPDYAEVHYNLGIVFQDLGQLDEAIECLKRAETVAANLKTSAVLLELYYRNLDREGFDRQLERISKNKRFNFGAASTSAFVSHQWDTGNSYKFCDDPVDLVTVHDLLDAGDVSPVLITEIETAIKNNTGNEKFEPGHITAGFSSIGNLFAEKSQIFKTLEQVIRSCVGSFVKQHNDNQSLLFRDWPAEYILNGWYMRLVKGGEISAHVHQGWLSGVFYVRVPVEKKNNAGNIEFTLQGYDLPVVRNDFPRRVVTTQPGRLVLFPSSLPHRVFPFSGNEERISISFDIVPK